MSTANRSPRGRGSRGRSQAFGQRVSASLPMPAPSQRLLQKLHASAILSEDIRYARYKIREAEQIASFNWKDTPTPTILVPGKPPKWQPPSIIQTLHEDGGLYYRDPNSARYPSYPTEPAIRAILTHNPAFDLRKIDIFGCGSTFGSLLSFVQGEEREFRFGVELIGHCLFFVRKTNKPGELIEGVYGYGHTFPEAYTTWDKTVKASASHQRIVGYDFAGLKCFIRSESDGYLPELTNQDPNYDTLEHGASDQPSDVDPSQLLSLALGLKPSDPSKSARLAVEDAGQTVPQRAVFDLKTRSIKRKSLTGVDVEEFIPRLWVNQTHNMILAYHTRGRFDNADIHVIDVRNRVLDWEARNVALLSRLGALLSKLVQLAKKVESKRFEVRRIGRGPIELWTELQGWSALPDDLKNLFHETSETHSTMDTGGPIRCQAGSNGEKEPNEEAVDGGDDDDDDDDDYLQF